MIEKEESKEKQEYVLVEVPTGSAIAIGTPDGRNLSIELALVEILNKLDNIEKQVG